MANWEKMTCQYEPEFSWDYADGRYPHLSNNIAVGRTLAVGSYIEMDLCRAEWSETSDHLIVFINNKHPFFFSLPLAIPASIVGHILSRLRDMDKPLRKWYEVKFWLYRDEFDKWVFFLDNDPEAFSYLPWKHRSAERMLRDIMCL